MDQGIIKKCSVLSAQCFVRRKKTLIGENVLEKRGVGVLKLLTVNKFDL